MRSFKVITVASGHPLKHTGMQGADCRTDGRTDRGTVRQADEQTGRQIQRDRKDTHTDTGRRAVSQVGKQDD